MERKEAGTSIALLVSEPVRVRAGLPRVVFVGCAPRHVGGNTSGRSVSWRINFLVGC